MMVEKGDLWDNLERCDMRPYARKISYGMRGGGIRRPASAGAPPRHNGTL